MATVMAEERHPSTIQDQETPGYGLPGASTILPASDLPLQGATTGVSGCAPSSSRAARGFWSGWCGATRPTPRWKAGHPTTTPTPQASRGYFLGFQRCWLLPIPGSPSLAPSFDHRRLMVIPTPTSTSTRIGTATTALDASASRISTFRALHRMGSLSPSGVFFRGPGWNLFIRGTTGDPHRVRALTNIDLRTVIAPPAR